MRKKPSTRTIPDEAKAAQRSSTAPSASAKETPQPKVVASAPHDQSQISERKPPLTPPAPPKPPRVPPSSTRKRTISSSKQAAARSAGPEAKAPLKGISGVPPKVPAQPAIRAKKVRRQPTVPGTAVRSAAAPKSLPVPPLLLEGDAPHGAQPGGPGARYALAAGPVAPSYPTTGGELPQSYGTGRLFLAARDPHWLFASWDLDPEQQQECNRRSMHGHLILRVFANDNPSPAIPEVHVHPESRDWFLHVPNAATRYRAELGYYDARKQWVRLSESASTFTPPDAPSPELKADFATIPPEVTFQQVAEIVQQFASTNQPLLEAVVQANQAQGPAPAANLPPVTPAAGEPAQARNDETRRSGSNGQSKPRKSFQPLARPAPPGSDATRPSRAEFPQPPPSPSNVAQIPIRIEPGKPWTSAQRRALARLISIDTKRRVWMGSLEITELVRQQLQEEVSSISAAQLAEQAAAREEAPGPGAGVSSPLGGVPRKGRKFWFKVNAELIIYGSTEPDARVTIADRPVKLRPDGSFSFRFSLPDGRYQLPALAVSSDGQEGREARLEFSRATEYRGMVEPHPQDASLRPPHPGNIK